MRGRPAIVVLGAGRMANALCGWLAGAGYSIEAVVSRRLRPARELQRRYGVAHALRLEDFLATGGGLGASGLGLIAVPDDAIAGLDAALAAQRTNWRGWRFLHTSGAHGAGALRRLRARGAAVGSLHPMMTFPKAGRKPVGPQGVVFGIEGDAAARGAAEALVAAWRGAPLRLSAAAKSAYHLAATLLGPATVVHYAAAEAILANAGLRGVARQRARAGLLQLLAATGANLAAGGPAAWTGPWARGDLKTVALHLAQLKSLPLKRLYQATGVAATALLPVPQPEALRRKLAK